MAGNSFLLALTSQTCLPGLDVPGAQLLDGLLLGGQPRQLELLIEMHAEPARLRPTNDTDNGPDTHDVDC